MTLEDFKQAVEGYGRGPGGHERAGQAAFNALYECRPDLSEKIRGRDLDPFHLDARLPAFWEWVEANW